MKKAGMIALLAVTIGVGAFGVACGGSTPSGGTTPTSTDTSGASTATSTMPASTDTSGASTGAATSTGSAPAPTSTH